MIQLSPASLTHKPDFPIPKIAFSRKISKPKTQRSKLFLSSAKLLSGWLHCQYLRGIFKIVSKSINLSIWNALHLYFPDYFVLSRLQHLNAFRSTFHTLYFSWQIEAKEILMTRSIDCNHLGETQGRTMICNHLRMLWRLLSYFIMKVVLKIRTYLTMFWK